MPTAPYAGRVLERLGLADSFEAIHDVHASNYTPKPHPDAYRSVCDAYRIDYRIDPARAAFVEDMARNLAPAKAIGMTTIWVNNGSEQDPDADHGYIDFTTHDITHWLEAILEDQ